MRIFYSFAIQIQCCTNWTNQNFINFPNLGFNLSQCGDPDYSVDSFEADFKLKRVAIRHGRCHVHSPDLLPFDLDFHHTLGEGDS